MPKDSDFSSGLGKNHSQVGSGFFQRSPWLEGWGAGCRSRLTSVVQTLEGPPDQDRGQADGEGATRAGETGLWRGWWRDSPRFPARDQDKVVPFVPVGFADRRAVLDTLSQDARGTAG